MSLQQPKTIDWSELFNPSEPRYKPIETKSIWEMLGDKLTDIFVAGLESIAVKIIIGLPIMAGVAIGVYALTSMFSKTLARYGVIGVFIYGSLVAIF